jgi:hypothetical protein
MGWWIAAAVVVAVAIAVLVVRRRRFTTDRTAPRIDPYTVGEPWRRPMMQCLRAVNQVHAAIDAAPTGPLRDRLAEVARSVDRGLAETWTIARRGDAVDDAIARLDPPRLRAARAAEERRLTGDDDATRPEVTSAIESIDAQLAASERLRAESDRAAAALRLAATRLDELAARSTEIAVGIGDAGAYAHDAQDLVVELEAIRLAMDELDTP